MSAPPTEVLALAEAYHRAVRACDFAALRATIDTFPYPMAECNTCLGPSGPEGEVEGSDGWHHVCPACEGNCLFWGLEPLRDHAPPPAPVPVAVSDDCDEMPF